MEFFRALPERTVKLINLDRYETMMQTAAELKEILSQTNAQGELEITFCDRFNMGTISAELDDLSIANTPQFATMIAKADNFEIYPKTNGKIQLAIAFQSVLNPLR